MIGELGLCGADECSLITSILTPRLRTAGMIDYVSTTYPTSGWRSRAPDTQRPVQTHGSDWARSEVSDYRMRWAIGHFDNRTTRRCFLMGITRSRRQNFDHRKVWIDGVSGVNFTLLIGVNLLGVSQIPRTHIHCFEIGRPDVVAAWARRDTPMTSTAKPGDQFQSINNFRRDSLHRKTEHPT